MAVVVAMTLHKVTTCVIFLTLCVQSVFTVPYVCDPTVNEHTRKKTSRKNDAGAGNIQISILVTVSSNIDQTAYLLLGKPS